MIKKIFTVICICLLFLIIIPVNSLSINLKSMKFIEKITLSQDKEPIAYVSEFAVLEDECFLLNDVKDHKVMLFDSKGNQLKSWKSIGQGPGEYMGMWGNDYRHPYFGIYDLRTKKVILYQRSGKTQFNWIRDILDPKSYTKNFKLTKDSIIFDGPILYKNKYYIFHIKDYEGKNEEFCLPAAVRYGKPPSSDYKMPYARYRFTWGLEWSYLDFYNGYIYSAWEGMLNILKINLTTKEWENFGFETKNYKQPKILKNTTMNWKEKKQWKNENESKFSWIVGLFVDEDLVGLLYLVFNKKKSYYEPILQFYNGKGDFIKEVLLEGARDIYKKLNCYYSRDFGSLYVLNMTVLDSSDVKFEILKYKIHP